MRKQKQISSLPVEVPVHIFPPETTPDTKMKELTAEEIEELLHPFDEVEEDGPLNPDYFTSDEESGTC